jgi:hypothetical protein
MCQNCHLLWVQVYNIHLNLNLCYARTCQISGGQVLPAELSDPTSEFPLQSLIVFGWGTVSSSFYLEEKNKEQNGSF